MPREMAEKMVANKAKQKDQDDVLLDLEHNDLGCVNKKEKKTESREDIESSTNTKHMVSNSHHPHYRVQILKSQFCQPMTEL
jgi:hypothetical protein